MDIRDKAIRTLVAATLMAAGTSHAGDNNGNGKGPEHPGPKTAVVTVSAKASGEFGYNADPGDFVPLVKALTVSRSGTITIQYRSGEWCDGSGFCPGPNGHEYDLGRSWSIPLEEAIGVFGGLVTNHAALIGAFVPDSLTNRTDFRPLDGTKLSGGVGIMPNMLFFVGSFNVIRVEGPGTLYLGINDGGVGDNSGSLTVKVSAEMDRG